jgi:hypothetical protein
MIQSMKGIRASHPIWTVARVDRDEYGRDDGYTELASYWNAAEAKRERDRLEAANTDDSCYFVVTESVATVVYPEDEAPPWIDHPDRLKNRGYEML